MRRSSALGILVACLALVGGTVLLTAGSIAAGVWEPAWSRPSPTPGQVGDPGGLPQRRDYADFLAHVETGRVYNVHQEATTLYVDAEDLSYTVELPAPSPDVFGDMQAAAVAGGVPMPAFSSSSGGEPLPDRTYGAFLDEIATGRVLDVFHHGSRLDVNTADGSYGVELDDPDADVLGDIEGAADRAGVNPPPYTKICE